MDELTSGMSWAADEVCSKEEERRLGASKNLGFGKIV